MLTQFLKAVFRVYPCVIVGKNLKENIKKMFFLGILKFVYVSDGATSTNIYLLIKIYLTAGGGRL
jgi:hypothetical protein